MISESGDDSGRRPFASAAFRPSAGHTHKAVTITYLSIKKIVYKNGSIIYLELCGGFGDGE